ncbi:NAD-dependent epimerase/dehydratase family protein [Pedobacter nutrimenti]|uniref:NAD-dependent epimerase/dehydratase family protein n=1 Tax=Pedobacter nutrimenti TaxID=1241337 RepID=UPI00292ED26E|nr:NAD-dependent epimerase/dehydratase family protein [Pedobacter nutrimenti]
MGNAIESSHCIVITGGGGYLGSKLAERLAPLKCSVHLVDVNFNNLSKYLGESYDNVFCEILDLTEKSEVGKFIGLHKPDHIFHFASVIDRSRDFSIFEKLYRVNVRGTFNLLEALSEVPYLSFNFASTSEVYGDWNGTPFKEDDPLTPMSPYSLTKLYAENLIELYSKLNGEKPYNILRIFNFFGIDMPPTTFMGQMIECYLGGKGFPMTKGEQARDILKIDDLLDQVLFVVDSGNGSQILNICSGNSCKLIDIVKYFKQTVQSHFEYQTLLAYRDNEVWETKGDNNKIKLLGYKITNYTIESLLDGCEKI